MLCARCRRGLKGKVLSKNKDRLREPFIFAGEYLERPFSVVEVGVMWGTNAEVFIDYLKPEEVWLVDPWTIPPDNNYEWSRERWEFAYTSVCDKFAGNSGVKVLRMTSSSAAQTLDRHFSMVYIDADHAYSGVLEDMYLWYPKVLSGGILAGDDYDYPGVNKAVTIFSEKNNLGESLRISQDQTQWWLVK